MTQYNLIVGGETKRSRFKPRAMGTVEFDPTTLSVTVDGKALPSASVEHLVKYGLVQYIADGGAVGKDGDETDYISGTDARLANLIAGEFKRGKGERDGVIDNVETLAQRTAKGEILTAIKAAMDPKAEGYTESGAALAKALKADKDRLATVVAAHFDNGKEAFMKAAKAEIEARHKTAAKVDLAALGLKSAA